MGSIPFRGVESICFVAKKHKKQNRSNIETNSINTLKTVHIKKIFLKKENEVKIIVKQQYNNLCAKRVRGWLF